MSAKVSIAPAKAAELPSYLLQPAPWSAGYNQIEFLQRLLICGADGNVLLSPPAQLAQYLGIGIALAQEYLENKRSLPAELLANAVLKSGAGADYLLRGGTRQTAPYATEDDEESLLLKQYRSISSTEKAAFMFVLRLHDLLHGLPREIQCGIFKSLWAFRAFDETGAFEDRWGRLLDAGLQKFQIREGFNPLDDAEPSEAMLSPIHELYGVFGPEKAKLSAFLSF